MLVTGTPTPTWARAAGGGRGREVAARAPEVEACECDGEPEADWVHCVRAAFRVLTLSRICRSKEGVGFELGVPMLTTMS